MPRLLRLPPPTVRLRLTLLYSGLFLVSGVALLVATYLIFRATTGVDLIVPSGALGGSAPAGAHGGALTHAEIRRATEMFDAALRRNSRHLHQGLIESGVALAIMTAVSVALGWLVAGRVLRPLRTMTATTRRISESVWTRPSERLERNLSERLALTGPRDELKDLGDTVDGLLDRIEARVAEQRRFAANASHELRTPLAITRTLLEVARSDRNGSTDELVDRLEAVNTRAIDLTEALLVLSRADQRSFTRESVDLSLIAEEATEALLPLAERHRVALHTSGEVTLVAGSPTLLLQLTMNLVHNAIVHNLPGQGTVWVTTDARPEGALLTVESTGEPLAPERVATLVEPFQRGAERVRTDHAGVGLGLAIVQSIARAHDGTLTLTPRLEGGLRVSVRLPGAGRAGG